MKADLVLTPFKLVTKFDSYDVKRYFNKVVRLKNYPKDIGLANSQNLSFTPKDFSRVIRPQDRVILGEYGLNSKEIDLIEDRIQEKHSIKSRTSEKITDMLFWYGQIIKALKKNDSLSEIKMGEFNGLKRELLVVATDCLYGEPQSINKIKECCKIMNSNASFEFIRDSVKNINYTVKEESYTDKINEAVESYKTINNLARPKLGLALALGLTAGLGLTSLMYPVLSFGVSTFLIINEIVFNNKFQNIIKDKITGGSVIDQSTLYSTNKWNICNSKDFKACLLSSFLEKRMEDSNYVLDYKLLKDLVFKLSSNSTDSNLTDFVGASGLKFVNDLNNLSDASVKNLISFKSLNVRDMWLEKCFSKSEKNNISIEMAKMLDMFVDSNTIINKKFHTEDNVWSGEIVDLIYENNFIIPNNNIEKHFLSIYLNQSSKSGQITNWHKEKINECYKGGEFSVKRLCSLMADTVISFSEDYGVFGVYWKAIQKSVTPSVIKKITAKDNENKDVEAVIIKNSSYVSLKETLSCLFEISKEENVIYSSDGVKERISKIRKYDTFSLKEKYKTNP